MRFVDSPLKRCATPAGNISFRETGDGPRALLFLHGLSSGSGSWGWQFDAFGAKFRCIAWDAPGYGESQLRAERTVHDYADAAIALLDGLGVDHAVVVGHSMGGVVAGQIAAQMPRRVTGLLLSCTHTGYANPPGDGFTDGHRRRLDEIDRMPAAEYGAARAADMLAPGAHEDVVSHAARLAGLVKRPGLEQAIHMILEADTTTRLGRITAPVALIAGEQDRTVPRARTDALAAHLPQGDRYVIAGAAHAPYLEKPVAFNRVVTTLLSRAVTR